MDVFQVQAPELFFHYATFRSKMPATETAREQWVWHGCSKASAESIAGLGTRSTGGFDWRFSGAHATAYGQGAYFARNASYSCSPTYSPADTVGLHRVFYAQLMVDDNDLVKGPVARSKWLLWPIWPTPQASVTLECAVKADDADY